MENSYVKFETPEDLQKNILDLVENSYRGGKIRKGTNEVIKSVERGEAKLVVIAEDVTPPEVVYYLPTLCDEKKVPYGFVKSRESLGTRVGISSAASISVVDYGKNEESYKKIVEDLSTLKK
ncbi:MAG: 50S ribosomal protein L7Ae [Candidatus Thermoplasmatota archaeon]|nr:50S ribosomal protein L7Ae [Candidatus Thermoplasmatota archaeon]